MHGSSEAVLTTYEALLRTISSWCCNRRPSVSTVPNTRPGCETTAQQQPSRDSALPLSFCRALYGLTFRKGRSGMLRRNNEVNRKRTPETAPRARCPEGIVSDMANYDASSRVWCCRLAVRWQVKDDIQRHVRAVVLCRFVQQ
jgi:hypothetical protein